MFIIWPIHIRETEEEREARLARNAEVASSPWLFWFLVVFLGVVLLLEMFWMYTIWERDRERQAAYELRMAGFLQQREQHWIAHQHRMEMWREAFKEIDFDRRHHCAILCWDWPRDEEIPSLVNGN